MPSLQSQGAAQSGGCSNHGLRMDRRHRVEVKAEEEVEVVEVARIFVTWHWESRPLCGV